MSYDLAVFDKKKAPDVPEEFFEWFEEQTEWADDYDYNDVKHTSDRLRRFFLALKDVFPPMNGPFAVSDEEFDSNPDIEARLCDYCIGPNMIYMSFGYSMADMAYDIVQRNAFFCDVGFFSASDNIIWYQDDSPETRDKIIGWLEREDLNSLQANKCLIALAAIGDETVVEYFKKWEEEPPAWRESLHVGPLEYAMEGSWCIEDGRKKSLHFEVCYALEQTDECTPEENVFGGTSADKCPYCGSSYMNMLVIDGRDERLAFLGLNGRIKIKYCDCCLPWEDFLYCRYEEDGESTVINRTGGSGEFFEDEELNDHKPFVLSKKPVPENYCNEFDGSAVGGIPAFIDDAKYAVCPDCGKRMKHLAQLGMEWTDCGTEYIQICTDCKIAAVTYQQT